MINTAAGLNTMTPAEIDALLFPAEEKVRTLAARLANYRDAAAKPGSSYLQRYVEQYEREVAEAREVVRPLAAEYDRRGGWTRYLKVVGDGHVHASTSCSTCFATTLWARVPALSGLTPIEMVEAVGDRACSICYPWAPALPSYRPVEDPERKAAREARETRKAEIAAKRERNALESVDGRPLMDGTGRFARQITTVTEAKSVLKRFAETEAYGYHPDSTAAAERPFRAVERERIAAALAAKLGGTAAQYIEKAAKLAR